MNTKIIIEPFRIKSVEPITLATPEHREAALRTAGFNLFALHSAEVVAPPPHIYHYGLDQ